MTLVEVSENHQMYQEDPETNLLREAINVRLEELGLNTPDVNEQAMISQHLHDYMLSQYRKDPKDRTMMLETELLLSDIRRLEPGKKALIIGMGGSNIYWNMIGVDANGLPYILTHEGTGRQIGGKVALERKQFASPTDFAVELIRQIERDKEDSFADILDEITPDAFGLVFSYPHRSFRRSYGIDVVPPDVLPKDITIHGASLIETGIGEVFYDAIRIAYQHDPKTEKKDLPYVLPIATRNDSELTEVYSKYHELGMLAGVCGTGLNFSILMWDEEKQDWKFVNMEAGSIPIVLHKLARNVDHLYTNEGEPRIEKVVSGKYIGDQFDWLLRDLYDRGLLHVKLRDEVKANSKTISDVLNGDMPALNEIFDATEDDILRDLPLLLEPASRLRDFSAAYLGMLLETICFTFPHVVVDNHIIVTMEGSVIQYMLGHKELVIQNMENLAERFGMKLTAQIHTESKASLLGSAIVALSDVWRNKN